MSQPNPSERTTREEAEKSLPILEQVALFLRKRDYNPCPNPDYYGNGEQAVRLARKLAKDYIELLAERDAALADKERLDWVEQRRLRLNQHYGTDYGWKFVSSHNVNRLFVKDVNTIDLNDSEARHGNIREAIDAARKEKG